MSYKTILAPVEDSKNLDPLVQIAAHLAAAENAHLIGVALTGVSRFIHETLSAPHDDPNFEPYLRALRQRADAALTRFENLAHKCGVTSFERRLVDDEIAGGVSLLARCCDLVVLAQPDPNQAASMTSPAFPEYVLMNCGVPGLVIPYVSSGRKIGDRALLAWNATAEAARAVRYALPLLKRAAMVEVAIFNADSSRLRPDPYGDPPGADIAHFLLRHNIKVDVLTPTTDADIGNALLTLAGTRASDLLVMGCYGHSRFREVILGGTTQTVLKSTVIPVLMSH
jgi:nucleotide-binding universal stress UspA family protein